MSEEHDVSEATTAAPAPEATPEATPEAAPGATSEATPVSGPPAQARAGRLRDPRLAWTVAMVTTIAAIGFALAWAPLYSADRDRERVRQAAEQLVLHLTTFEGETIDGWVQETQRRATDQYAEEVNTLFDPQLRAALRDAKAKSAGRLVNLFVQDVDGDDALVFAVVRQTITNAASPTPVEDELRMQIELRRIDGGWKAAKVEVLGPGNGGAALVDDTAGEAP